MCRPSRPETRERENGIINGFWSGPADRHAADDCPVHATVSAIFTQDGVWVTGTLPYGGSREGCVYSFNFDGELLGNALVGSTTSGSTTAPAQGTLSGDTLELAGWQFDLHVHR